MSTRSHGLWQTRVERSAIAKDNACTRNMQDGPGSGMTLYSAAATINPATVALSMTSSISRSTA